MSSSVEKIKEKISIVDVVSTYISLEKAGAHFKAKCPFHNEKSASFFVSPVRNTYYCFGCGAKGDIFSFVQEFEGLDFMGALRILSEKAGVPLERENPSLRTEREKLYAIMEHATLFFQRQLGAKPDAREYLKKRGIIAQTARLWRIGYAPIEWRALTDYLLSKKIRIEDIEKVGLAKASEKRAGDHYDRFRGRIMFPIFDASGRPIAFSGRQFEKDGTEAKYINSPETALFQKSHILFGYDKAKLEIRKKDYAVLVEGQMDLLLSHQIGITNTVASSGTALTIEQLEILKRLSHTIVIAYDGDKAGRAAAQRGWSLALGLGMNVKIAVLPDGKDPADVAQENPELLKKSISEAQHIIDVELEYIATSRKDAREKILEIEKTIIPLIAGVHSQMEKSHFISKVAAVARMREDVVWKEVQNYESKNTPATSRAHDETPAHTPLPKHGSLERHLFSILFWQEKLIPPVLDLLDIKRKLSKIIGTDRFNKLSAELAVHKDELAFEADISHSGSSHILAYVDELIVNLKEEYLKKQFADTMSELHQAEQAGASDQVLSLLKKCQEISIELRKIAELRSHAQ